MSYVATQGITSKNTSINSTKLPAIYNKINWDKLEADWIEQHDGQNPIGIILDYGCGRYTQHIEDFVNKKGFYYIGYDPYWNPCDFQEEIDQISKINGGGLVAIICSNVLNVIPSWNGAKEVYRVIHYLAWPKAKYFFTVYEGDKSGRGRVTKEDCWQWNRPASNYVFGYNDKLTKGVITDKTWGQFLK